jgi:hypothetical protein
MGVLRLLGLFGVMWTLLQTSELAHARSEFLANLGQGMVKKGDAKYQDRWTLGSWFETQRQTRLQDMWLAGNRREDIYDFMLGGQTGVRTTVTEGVESNLRSRGIQADAIAYATLVGLEGHYIDLQTEGFGWQGSLGLRLIGDSRQNTNLTVLYGIGSKLDVDPGAQTSDEVQNHHAKARLTLYLTRAFGVEASYQTILLATSRNGAEIEGSAVDATAFLDFSFLRIFGTWSRETQLRKFQAISSERNRESIDAGLKLFF